METGCLATENSFLNLTLSQRFIHMSKIRSTLYILRRPHDASVLTISGQLGPDRRRIYSRPWPCSRAWNRLVLSCLPVTTSLQLQKARRMIIELISGSIPLQSRLNNGWSDAKLSQRHRLKLRNFFVVVHFSTLLALLRCLQASYFMRVLWANLTMHTHILSDHGRLVLHFVNDSNKSPTIYHIPPWLAEDSPIFANLTFQVHQASGCYVLLYVWVA